MAKPPKFCRDGDSFYGYDPVDVVRVGQEGRAGVKGTPGAVGPRGPKGDQGEQGPPGSDLSVMDVQAGETIHGRRVIRMVDGLAYHPDLLNNEHALQVLGIALAASVTGASFPVRTSGPVYDAGWNWDPGYVYCSTDGVLTQSPPSTGWLQRVGRVINPTTFNVDIDTPFIRNF